MKKIFVCLLTLSLCAPIFAQQQVLVKNEPVAWCELQTVNDKGDATIYTLECVGDKIKLTLDIPKSEWFANWGSPGSHKFYALGRGDDGKLYALKTVKPEAETDPCLHGLLRGEECSVHGGRFIKRKN